MARPFVLRPFRGLRFDPERVGDLGTVISPPYDVLDAELVRQLEATNRRNIVRLILSRRFEAPYLAVRERLESWRRDGYLKPDPTTALYLYQYRVDQVSVRGLVGLAALRDEAERVILPHEDVMPGPVEDRMMLMRTTRTNLEPILLLHEGTQRLRTLLSEVAAGPSVAAFGGQDGSRHRVWRVTDPSTLQAIAEELAPTRALIADGHHRYAAYQGLQHLMRADRDGGSREVSSEGDLGGGGSPWDYGLALLVDQHDHPLQVGPIHRSVAAMTMAELRDLARTRGDRLRACADREAAFRSSIPRVDEHTASFVVSDGQTWAVLYTTRTHAVDAAVLHESLLPAWRVREEQLGYHHSLDQALHTIARQPGVVVAVRPPSVADVMASAARGERMPRKSTSFTPKPRMGVVMRDLRDG